MFILEKKTYIKKMMGCIEFLTKCSHLMHSKVGYSIVVKSKILKSENIVFFF